jgi:hypothetical protein
MWMMTITRALRPSASGFFALVAIASSSLQAAPQMPLAAGSHAQLDLVKAAARKCGFRRFRVAESAFSYKYLYTDDDLGSYPCIESWLKKRARGIGLAPRYESDAYER